ncbi:MAG TPA: hypothetical protein VEH04_11430 [Verrucomicrobiae bacterium]|nr:hypothetical protein [Verrucomicrobiae bacterium]
MNNEIDLSIDIEPYWCARVEVRQGTVSMRRTIESPAKTADQAKERMTAALSLVWKKFEFLSEPVLKERIR